MNKLIIVSYIPQSTFIIEIVLQYSVFVSGRRRLCQNCADAPVNRDFDVCKYKKDSFLMARLFDVVLLYFICRHYNVCLLHTFPKSKPFYFFYHF